jgi:hypothetical protein
MNHKSCSFPDKTPEQYTKNCSSLQRQNEKKREVGGTKKQNGRSSRNKRSPKKRKRKNKKTTKPDSPAWSPVFTITVIAYKAPIPPFL